MGDPNRSFAEMLWLESLLPVRFYAARIVGLDDVQEGNLIRNHELHFP